MIFLSGSSGFVGKNILEKSYFKNVKVFSKSELLYLHNLEFKKEKKSYFLHFASPLTKNKKLIDDEISLLEQVMTFCCNNDVSLIYPSTGFYECISNEGSSETDDIFLKDDYACAKYRCEQNIISCHEKYNLNAIILRIFNLYGPNQRENYFLPAMLKKILKNEHIEIFSDIRRDYLHVNDLIELLIAICGKNHNGLELYNVGSAENYSSLEILDKFLCYFNDFKKYIIKTSSIIEPKITLANIDKVSKKYEWQPNESLELFVKYLATTKVKKLENES